MIDFPKLLTDYMSVNDVSQRSLAKALSVSEASISRYIKRERNPCKRVLDKMLEMSHLNVSDYEITDVKALLKQLICDNFKHFSAEDKLELIRIIAQ